MPWTSPNKPVHRLTSETTSCKNGDSGWGVHFWRPKWQARCTALFLGQVLQGQLRYARPILGGRVTIGQELTADLIVNSALALHNHSCTACSKSCSQARHGSIFRLTETAGSDPHHNPTYRYEGRHITFYALTHVTLSFNTSNRPIEAWTPPCTGELPTCGVAVTSVCPALVQQSEATILPSPVDQK